MLVKDADVGAAKEPETVNLAIYAVQCKGAVSGDSLADVGVVIEGCTKDLRHVQSLFGLIYCLSLNYPKDLRYTFEFLQKVVMELDEVNSQIKCKDSRTN